MTHPAKRREILKLRDNTYMSNTDFAWWEVGKKGVVSITEAEVPGGLGPVLVYDVESSDGRIFRIPASIATVIYKEVDDD